MASPALLLLACSSSSAPDAGSPTKDAGVWDGYISIAPPRDAGKDASRDVGGQGHDGSAHDAASAGPDAGGECAALGLTNRAFTTTGTGTSRGDTAGDFTLPMIDGTSFTLSKNPLGCETYVFLPDTLTVSQTNTASLWDSDLPALVAGSPTNVHYFFVSLQNTDAAASTNTTAMQAKVAALLGASGGLSAAKAVAWKQHLHVVSGRAGTYGSWVGTTLLGWGQPGFAIDLRQRLRGVGYLSDVTRQIANPPANSWPFESNLAYAANEPVYMNAQGVQLNQLDAENATVVPVFTGQVLQGQGYMDVPMPSAAALAGFDTLEVEITMACPDPTEVELSSCGPWDYLAQLFLDTPVADAGAPDAGVADAGITDAATDGAHTDAAVDAASAPDAGPPVVETELARFITSYGRETHWVEDISPMMPLLPGGSTPRLHYSYAPSWNVQPTAVTLSLRFSNQHKGFAASTLTPIASGGTFNDMYNAGRTPVSAVIPADTKHAELWMIVTGHGSDSYQCGEFCDSQHVFTVNGMANTWTVDFPGAGTESGCIPEDSSGMVPNQIGTWWYGRDGWCPGQQVTPHVWDITSLVTPGSAATVTYEGLFNNVTPPSDGSGNIVLTSYVVTFH